MSNRFISSGAIAIGVDELGGGLKARRVTGIEKLKCV